MITRIKIYAALVFALAVLTGCGGGGGGGTSTNPSLPTLSILDQSGFEPNSGTAPLNFVVNLSAASNSTVTVSYATMDGSATASTADYTPSSGTLTFLAGETHKTIPVDVLSDTPGNEHDEFFSVTLTNPNGATLARSQATGTIVDIVVRPDTGITTCGNATSNLLTCPQTGYDQQDAEFGRDKTYNDNSDGRAGFSFTKLDSNGNALAASATSWSCVRDNVTGLIWEIKTSDNGLRDRNNTFTWYNSDSATNGGNAGAQTGGACTGGISCNSAAYVAAVNAVGLCGANDWRMPTADELLSLHDYGATTAPGIDTNYFNDLVISGTVTYWASESDASNSSSAWIVDYAIGSGGNSSVADKAGFTAHVRLVRKP